MQLSLWGDGRTLSSVRALNEVNKNEQAGGGDSGTYTASWNS
jgi:hypothetical protein